MMTKDAKKARAESKNVHDCKALWASRANLRSWSLLYMTMTGFVKKINTGQGCKGELRFGYAAIPMPVPTSMPQFYTERDFTYALRIL